MCIFKHIGDDRSQSHGIPRRYAKWLFFEICVGAECCTGVAITAGDLRGSNGKVGILVALVVELFGPVGAYILSLNHEV